MGAKSLILNKIQEHLNIHRDIEFARYLGITPQALSNWKKRDTFDMQTVYTKCGFINPHYLLTGEGRMLKSALNYEHSPSASGQKVDDSVSDNDVIPMHKTANVPPKAGESVPPTVPPTLENCKICDEKDTVIAEQRARILDLKEFIELLRQQIPDQKKAVG